VTYNDRDGINEAGGAALRRCFELPPSVLPGLLRFPSGDRAISTVPLRNIEERSS
jgi:hypothetical protein